MTLVTAPLSTAPWPLLGEVEERAEVPSSWIGRIGREALVKLSDIFFR